MEPIVTAARLAAAHRTVARFGAARAFRTLTYAEVEVLVRASAAIRLAALDAL